MNARRFACALLILALRLGAAPAEVKYVKIETLGNGAFRLTGEGGGTETIRLAGREE